MDDINSENNDDIVKLAQQGHLQPSEHSICQHAFLSTSHPASSSSTSPIPSPYSWSYSSSSTSSAPSPYSPSPCRHRHAGQAGARQEAAPLSPPSYHNHIKASLWHNFDRNLFLYVAGMIWYHKSLHCGPHCKSIIAAIDTKKRMKIYQFWQNV